MRCPRCGCKKLVVTVRRIERFFITFEDGEDSEETAFPARFILEEVECLNCGEVWEAEREVDIYNLKEEVLECFPEFARGDSLRRQVMRGRERS